MINFKETLPEELEAMSDLFQHEGYKVLHKLMNNRIISLGDAALSANSMEEVAQYRGIKEGIQMIDAILKLAHQKKEKSSAP